MIPLLHFLGIETLLAQATSTLVTPTAITQRITGAPNGPDFFPADNLIDGSGLSNPNPTFSNYASVIHDFASATTAWVTGQGFAQGGYFYLGPNGNPILNCELGELKLVNGMIIWGYHFFGGTSGNEARSFRVKFSSDGGATFPFANDVELRSFTPLGSGAFLMNFPTRLADVIEVEVRDNHFNTIPAPSEGGGDRVGLGELRFVSGPSIVTSAEDSGPGTLRQIINDFFTFGAPVAGTAIEFDSSIDGSTITLASDLPQIEHSVSISAASLPNGITINGNGNTIFSSPGSGNWNQHDFD